MLVGILNRPALAQETDSPAEEAESGSHPVFAVAGKVADAFTRPVHPVIDTIASGGGLGGGIGYDLPVAAPWSLEAKGLATPRGYWVVQAESTHRRSRGEVTGYARLREMSRLNYFGSGTASDTADWTTFSLREPIAGALASLNLPKGLKAGGRAELLWPDVSGGEHPGHPSIEQRFDETTAPGLAAQPRFARYQLFAQAALPRSNRPGRNLGGDYRISYDIYDDQQLDQFDFRRVELEGRHRLAIFHPFQTLTLRGWMSTSVAGDGDQVPFYLQRSLGGTSNLRSVSDAPVGGDDTAATLRGFHNLRFRDNHLLLLQAEYRFHVWGPVDGTVFVDSGKAVPERSQLDLSGLKTNYGFSLSVMRAATTLTRLDVGFGGDEGARVFFTMGGFLP